MHKTVSKTTVLKNRFLELTKESYLKKNKEIAKDYYVINRANAVVIIAFVKATEPKIKSKSSNRNPKIILVRQYRHAVRSDKEYELPAGYIEKNESPLSAAKRELKEETGFTAKKFKKIGETYMNASLLKNCVHYFLALDAEKKFEQHLDPNEEIDIKISYWNDVIKMIESGKIKDAGSVNGILLAKNYLATQKK